MNDAIVTSRAISGGRNAIGVSGFGRDIVVVLVEFETSACE